MVNLTAPGAPMAQGDVASYDDLFTTAGDLLCTTGQVNAMIQDNINSFIYEFAPASTAGTLFGIANQRNTGVKCTLISYSTSPVSVSVYRSILGRANTVTISNQYDIEIVTGLITTDEYVTFLSNGPISVACMDDLRGIVVDHTVLVEMTADPVYGWSSNKVSGMVVACSSGISTLDLGQPSCDNSAGSSPTISIIDDDVWRIAVTGSSYSGPSLVCSPPAVANRCIGATTSGDINGGEMTSFFPKSRFSDFYVLAVNSGRYAVLSDEVANCTANGNEWFPSITGSTGITKANLVSGVLAAGTVIRCDRPVMIVMQTFEDGGYYKEYNLFGLEDDTLMWDSVGSQYRIECTDSPTKNPTQSPTYSPTEAPTLNPTKSPTFAPTQAPTYSPTQEPTESPVPVPTGTPTVQEESEGALALLSSPAVIGSAAGVFGALALLAIFKIYGRKHQSKEVTHFLEAKPEDRELGRKTVDDVMYSQKVDQNGDFEFSVSPSL